jgi:TrpR-related protein YerC/YecD
MSFYPSAADRELIKALASLKGEKEITGFLRDVGTIAEIQEWSQRFQIAKLLWTTQKNYLDIAAKVGTSTTTVTRVAHWLFDERYHGYQTVLRRLYGEAKR